MDFILTELKEKFQKSLEHLKGELSAIRTGTAQGSLLEDIRVSVYGTEMRLVELSSINTPDPHLIIVQPWDVNLLEEVAKAIRDSELNLNGIVEGNIIRVPLPPLTEERRLKFLKLATTKVEEAKVAVRNIRREALDKIKSAKDKGEIGEDDEFRLKRKVQEEVVKVTEEIVGLGKSKEEELLKV